MLRRYFAAALLILAAVASSSFAEEGHDHPIVSRYPGATILSFSAKEFDEYELILSPSKNERFAKTQRIEGKVTRIRYSNPAKRSALEIFRNYQESLTRAGFQTLFACGGRECGEGIFDSHQTDIGRWCIGGMDCKEPMRFIAAKLSRKAGDVYVAVKVMVNPWPTNGTYLNVIEVKPMEGGLVKIDADAMSNDLKQTGHVSLYGIYFDTAKSDVKPDSKPMLDEIAILLKREPNLKLYVVGHTDNVGAFASNLTLSKARAQAVVDALVKNYHIAPKRLTPNGVASLAPVAANADDAGRAKNRRVELVAQ